VITSLLKSNGQLTWTNSTPESHFTYKVEWASSPEGPWQNFSALTNLSRIQTTNQLVAVNVPTFFRVVWVDPPLPLGSYEYFSYDAAGTLIVTGKLALVSLENSSVSGNARLQSTGAATNGAVVVQVGSDKFSGSYFSGSPLSLTLNPNEIDNRFRLRGKLTATNYSGFWLHEMGATGTFNALRIIGSFNGPPSGM
jgi:hypothetical protein